MSVTNSGKLVTPYENSEAGKKAQVARMFDEIANAYDFLNRLLSVGIDILWRKTAVNRLRSIKPQYILDVATGTGDFAIAARKLNPKSVIGIDISEKMLAIGQNKISKKKLDSIIRLQYGDCESLAFYDNSFDAITVGFGARNFENLELGLSEILRTLKPNGMAIILEPGEPQNFPIKQFYKLYFTKILPFVGKLVSRNARAYSYLPESVAAFPHGKDFLDICTKVGFKRVNWQPLSFGICAMYCLEK